MEPETIFYGVLAFAWLEFIWETYLSFRQRRIYHLNTKLPSELTGIQTEETFTKARLYALDKSQFGAVQGVFSQIISTYIIWLHGFKYFYDIAAKVNNRCGLNHKDEIVVSMMFVLLMNVFNTVINIPFTVYGTFVLEEKHGFNKQTPGFFIKDQIKKFIVMQIITLPLVAAIIKIVHWGGDYFFLYLWCFVVVFTLFMLVVYPEVIAPLFDKYTPLPEGSLRSQIEALASEVKFPLYKLFVVEGSKRSSHSNAYFYGFFNFKRIVLFDTLLDKSEREKLKTDEDRAKEATDENEEKESKEDSEKGCSTPEILAILGHELGHWKMNHVLKNLVISQVHIFAMFALFATLYKYQALYTAFGFPDSQPVLIGLMIILQFIMAPYNNLLDFAMTILSRRFEFQADDFACTVLKRGEHLASSLIKLNNDNLSFPIYDWLYSAWHHSHPPLLERLAAINEKLKKD